MLINNNLFIRNLIFLNQLKKYEKHSLYYNSKLFFIEKKLNKKCPPFYIYAKYFCSSNVLNGTMSIKSNRNETNLQAEYGNHRSDDLNNIFNFIFSDFKIEEINSDNRKEKLEKKIIDNKNFIYGEVQLESLMDIVKLIEMKDSKYFLQKDKKFLDIGSGTGKAVIGMGLLNKFKVCNGVEIMENLFLKSELIKEKYFLYCKQKEFEHVEINFFNENILQYNNIHEADVIFANSTCWTRDFINQLYPQIRKIKKNAYFVNTDQIFYHNISKDIWEVYLKLKTQMSWGDSYLYVMRKKV